MKAIYIRSQNFFKLFMCKELVDLFSKCMWRAPYIRSSKTICINNNKSIGTLPDMCKVLASSPPLLLK
jgi:hypothetical protein